MKIKTTSKPQFPTSKHPVVSKLNDLIYATFPPKWNGHSWEYGKLYYYGFHRDWGHQWYLDGMTPVGVTCVLEILQQRGKNVDEFRNKLVPL